MSNSEEFWLDDPPTSRAAELSMPPASVLVPAELVGSHARASADYRAMPKSRNNAAGLLVAGVTVAVLAGVLWHNRPDVITLAEFEALQVGQSIEQCNEIIGSAGNPVLEMDLSEAVKGMPNLDGYQWLNRDGSNATASFQNGKLYAKFQLGL